MTLPTQKQLDSLRLDLSVKAKNGVNFVLSAALVWSFIALIWTLPYSLKSKAILTFMIGSLLLPFAWLFSKWLRTVWSVEQNPLQPLGLWLNVAQLVYFPILIFVFIRQLEYFLLVYAIITGAHLFPYAWFYNTLSYAVVASVISVGSMGISLVVSSDQLYLVALFTAGSLAVLTVWATIDYQTRMQVEKD